MSKEQELEDAQDALDEIAKVVGWGSNPGPVDLQEAVDEVKTILWKWVNLDY